ncbi:hypothetical protein TSUD_312040 [Trifolium subterraneum]|uniref:Integrase catalytic domain-containing protein n=1 Tax=Trifolium subterraneum TaxID=3900 RepID=A0A2Z6N0M9_TRISU|nr:hypothetical protein TSUD_312040 [Trifolium subterraneum]
MADKSEFLHPSVPKFDGYYEHWAMLMENLLRSKEFWSLIETGVTVAPPQATAEQLRIANESKLKDLKVKNYLFQSIDRTIIETILVRETAKDIWDAMQRKYQGSSRVKRAQLQALRRDFEVLAMRDGESVDEYFGRVLTIANRMTVHGERLEAVTIVEKILRSMHPRFNHVVCSIEVSCDVTTLSVEELQSTLLVHEQRLKVQQDSVEEQALKISSAGRGYGRGRGRSTSRGRGRGRQINKETIECFKCHKLGHYRSECPDWGENANYAEFNDEEETLLMAKTEHDGVIKEETWYLDSGCSNHMIGNKDWLFDFDASFRDSVRLGNDAKMSVMGRGSVKLFILGKVHVISNVYYLPGLNTNLLSVGQLQQKNVTIIFKNDVCKAYHDEKGLIFSTPMSTNRMYIITAPVLVPMCLQTSIEDNTQLWHLRYGHLSIKGLKLLSKKDMVKGLPALQDMDEKCIDCLNGKQQREAIPKQAKWRATTKLQLIHSDICGPINPSSNGGKRYFLTFTDDFSRKTWVYVLKEKSEAFEIFKIFKAMVELESGCMIQALRTDRGGEFTSSVFNEFCNSKGIKRQLTTAYTPQQNGVSERKNRTLLNMIRSMLVCKNVPKIFWPEALKWATYILNRSPTISVKNMTPEEAWSGTKPSVTHFRVFGCLAYAHVPDNHRKKLDNKSVKCVHLGISDESKAYKLYNPIEKKIVISRDVVFDESKGWDWDNKDKQNDNRTSHELLEDNNTEEDISGTDNENVSENENEGTGITNDSGTEEQVVENTSSDDDYDLGPRIRKTPSHLRDFVIGREAEEEQELHSLAVYNMCGDPNNYEEASKSQKWKEAMDVEIKAIQANHTWELTELPKNTKAIGVKWVYKTKYNEMGQVDKYKARLVVKGYSQKYGIDYNEVFAPVARWETIRTVLALAASKGWCVYQLDVKSAFLHGDLDEDIYVEQPLGYHQGDNNKVYKLKKALYGLKQAPRAWYSKIETYFLCEGFQKCPVEHTLFVKRIGNDILIISIYVDDLIVTGNNQNLITDFKMSMKKKFAMSDLGKMKFFLGVEVNQTEEGIFIHQMKYANEILSKFGMQECNSVCSPIVTGCKLVKNENGKACDAKSYKQMVGSLMYLLATRPDLAFAVCLVARFMERPTEMHTAAIKRIMRYVKGTVGLGIMYKRTDDNLQLHGWSDSDYAGDLDDRKSTSGYVFMLGSGAISWSSRKQPIVTLSTTEAEFVAAASCACQSLWLRNMLNHLSISQKGTTLIHCDNSSSIKLSKNPILRGRCKHIDVRFHFLRDLTKDGVIELVHCKSQEQLADVMTKPLKVDTFNKLRDSIGVREMM